MRLYKQGFTPGDNFVHKPEAGSEALLDRLRVRYVITAERRSLRGTREVARFGRIRVTTRTRPPSQRPAIRRSSAERSRQPTATLVR